MFRTALGLLLLTAVPEFCAAPAAKTREPQISSVFPFGAVIGQTWQGTIRGKNLRQASDLWFPGPGLAARVVSVAQEAADIDAVAVEFRAESNAALGEHTFRLVTPDGVSNEMSLRLDSTPVRCEPAEDQTITDLPLRIQGRIAKRGEVRTYKLRAAAGQTITFHVRSGFRSLDPAVAIAEQSGSWFDPQRINRIAANDEPLFFPGMSNDAHLVHRFERSGEYLVQVSSFSGQGGPDFVYELALASGAGPAPKLHPALVKTWEERQFTRALDEQWMSKLVHRGANPEAVPAVETFHAVPENSADIPVFSPPGLVEGRIAKPAETHVIRVRIDKPQNIAIEIETPEATMPIFNPVVRLSEAGGNELLTNVYTKLNNNGLYMMKMIQAKTTFSLGAPGVYTLQIRDITTDRAGADFAYRVLVRPQIPHAGKIACSADRYNLPAGETRPVSISFEREEGFGGVVALSAENLPPGVIALPAAEQPLERPPLPNGGKLERYTPQGQSLSVLLSASADAPRSEKPQFVRIVARPIVKGQLGDPIPVAEIPVMVVARRQE